VCVSLVPTTRCVVQVSGGLAAYVNPPSSERDYEEDGGERIALVDIPQDTIVVPACVGYPLDVPDGTTVSLYRLSRVPGTRFVSCAARVALLTLHVSDAQVVKLSAAEGCGEFKSDVVEDILKPYFGIGSQAQSNPAELLATLIAEGVNPASVNLEHLTGLVSKRQCRYRLLRGGQCLSIRQPATATTVESNTAGSARESVPPSGTAQSQEAVHATGAEAEEGSHPAAIAVSTTTPSVPPVDTRAAAVSDECLGCTPAWMASVSGWAHFVVVETFPRGSVQVGPDTVVEVVSGEVRE